MITKTPTTLNKAIPKLSPFDCFTDRPFPFFGGGCSFTGGAGRIFCGADEYMVFVSTLRRSWKSTVRELSWRMYIPLTSPVCAEKPR